MKRQTVGGNDWTVMSVSGTVSMSAELTTAAVDEMGTTLGLAQALGITTDVCGDFSDTGFSNVTFQFDGARIDTLRALVELLTV